MTAYKDRKSYYASLTVSISNAHRNLSQEDFQRLSESIKVYLTRLLEKGDKNE